MFSKSNNLFIGYGSVIITTILLFAGFSFALNGPHQLADNPCDVCHIPHHAADEMLWARQTTGPFGGVKRLCASCHGTGLFGAKDKYGIFESGEDASYDHVMGESASIKGQSVIRKDWEPLFPLKSNEGGEGFYCGTCHEPHQDPYEPIKEHNDQGGGDYLREEVNDSIKNSKDKETIFCAQCHNDLKKGDAYGHGAKQGCFDCHHPHNSPNSGSKILISLLIPFTAIPNCPGFTDAETSASACYGCHRSGSGFDGAIEAPLYGDDQPESREHHPMGLGADTLTSGHQPTEGGHLSSARELYCGSCHSVHDGTNDHYLNPEVLPKVNPKNSGQFCITCHSNKKVDALGIPGKDHYQIQPYNQCLFCHSIHNSPNDPDALYQTDSDNATKENSSASVDVIMRIPPVNMVWADRTLDTDTRDYEDACYGCHSRQNIVGSEFSLNEENALLYDNVRDRFFSHRFNVKPSSAIKIINTFDDRLPIVSDGKEKECLNDYGVDENYLWCGSCHTVHQQNKFSPDVSDTYIERRSAYLRADNYASSFCYRCHTTYHEDFNTTNHQQDKPLTEKYSKCGQSNRDGVLVFYYEGYSGGAGGITNGNGFDTEKGDIVCQSCHSVHSALTDFDGSTIEDNRTDHGKLIVKPLDEGFCQDCHPHPHGEGECAGNCISCHLPHKGIFPFIEPGNRFVARPNVIQIDDDPNRDCVASDFCYACHQGDDQWIARGAAPIYGDVVKGITITDSAKKRNHHPMGLTTKLTGDKFLKAPGTDKNLLNINNEITCTSCHNGLHCGSRENHFLRWDFTNDNAQFCMKCHSDKTFPKGTDNKHFKTASSPLNREVFIPDSSGNTQGIPCRQCMFCHFIHDGKDGDTMENVNEEENGKIRPDVKVLMRVKPKNLDWGDKKGDPDDHVDYEDMCYGCHGENIIVGGGCENGGLLRWEDALYTHRFASLPDPNSPDYVVDPPFSVIKPGGAFPLSDGDGNETLNDYGTTQGHIFCGTCHNVHDNTVTPYLNFLLTNSNCYPSPYEPKGFCECCHDADSEKFQFVHKSHPLDKGPLIPATVGEWPDTFYSGKSGCNGGVTYYQNNKGNVICLTCHNVHAAVTSWDGKLKEGDNKNHGKLLVKDNNETPEGSDLCKECHNFNE